MSGIAKLVVASVVFAAALSFAFLFAPPASAIDLDSVTCSWGNVLPLTTTAVNFPVNNTQTCEVRWGTSTGLGQSGLRFVGIAPPSQVISLLTPFDLGTLTHFNNPITGTPAQSLDLTIQLGISDGGPATPTFVFGFAVNETPNAGPCPVGSPPCADIITFPSALPGQTFALDGQLLTLELLGFGPSANNLTSSFISAEGGTNSTDLWARLRTPVPEPRIFVLMGLGLITLVTVRLRSAHFSEVTGILALGNMRFP